MGLCCSYEQSVNSHCSELPVSSDQGRIAVSPNGSSRSDSHPTQLPPAAAPDKVLFGMLVEDDARSWPPDEGRTPDAQQMKKMMAEIDVFEFKIIAKSCSQAAKGAAGVGRTDTSMHVQLRNGNKKLEIESKRKEAVISVNQTGRVQLANDAMKMDCVSVLSSGPLKDSYRDDSSVVRNLASQLESNRSENIGVSLKAESSPAEDGATAAASIQTNYKKKEPTSCKDATQKDNSFSTEQKGTEISIFSAEKYFTEEEPTDAARSDESTSYGQKTMTSSGFCFRIGEAQQCIPRHQAKSESTTDLEFPASTAFESDIWGSSMEDGDSLANFKKSSLQKTAPLQEINSILSTESSPLKKKQEEACLFGSEQRFEEGKKEKLGKTQLPSSKVQWHLAQVNSHEFVMSPRLQFSDSFVCPSSSNEDSTLCEMKQEANGEHGSQALEDSRAFEVARDEFSFDSLSSSCEISPQGMQRTAAARYPAVSYGESYRGSDSEFVKSSWRSPVHAHEQNNENAPYSCQAAIFLSTKSSSPFASPDFLIDNKLKECYHVLPSLNCSFSDLSEKSYQSPGNYSKMHGRNESDDYQSDMSADLFEIDRLEAPSSVSSPPTPPRISV